MITEGPGNNSKDIETTLIDRIRSGKIVHTSHLPGS